MVRLLFPLCVVALLWGCNSQPAAPPAPPPPPTAAGPGMGGPPAGIKPPPTEEPAAGGATEGDAAADDKAVPADTPADEEKEMQEEGAPAGDATPADEPKDEPQGEPGDEPKDEGAKTVDELLSSLRSGELQLELGEVATRLEKLVAKDPEHFEGRLILANILQNLGRQGGDGQNEIYLKSGKFLKEALKLKPELVEENPNIRSLAGVVLYNQACALAKTEAPAEALTTLKEAVGFGFSDMKLMSSDEDLASVRKLPEYEGFEKEAAEMIKVAAKKEIDGLLAKNNPFDFNFELDDIGGNKISKATYAGKVMIVDIWGTWCPPCRAEIPHFVELDKKYREKGLQIVGLNREQTEDADEAKALITKFNESQGVTYPCALITEEIMGQVPEFQGFPTTLFIDRKGTVRLKVVGARGPEFLEGVVEALLAEPAPEAPASN
ncbi:MAG: redoxin domain-containing protein [Planctomycetaceae bacterium]